MLASCARAPLPSWASWRPWASRASLSRGEVAPSRLARWRPRPPSASCGAMAWECLRGRPRCAIRCVFGAEIGISTDKLHARGPMALEELTTYKYVLRGNGQIRA